jgi:hypothetical protein
MPQAVALGMLLLLTGCVTEREALIEFYTKADIDAINAQAQCRHLARNAFQLSLCEPIRR